VTVTLPGGARPDGLDPALVALADAVADRHGVPTVTVTAAMLRLDNDPDRLWAPARDGDEHRLYVPGGIRINGTQFHLLALEVTDQPADDATFSQQTVHPDDGDDFDAIARLTADGPLTTTTIRERPYVLVAVPFAT
jgi:hypothetical protein